MKRRRQRAFGNFGIGMLLPVVTLAALTNNAAAEAARNGNDASIATYREKVLALGDAFVKANEARIRELFGKLDLARPELKPCADLYAKGDLKGSAEALLDYYASMRKTLPVDALDHHAEGKVIALADDELKGVFTEQNISAAQKLRQDGKLDWADEGPNGDKEWAWFLNRHFFLRDLAEAYLTTGNRNYERAISAYIEDWVLANPYPARLNFTAQWRPLEAARRVTDAWAVIFYDPDVHLTPEARLLMLCSLPDHADDLANHGSFWGGNHLLTEQSALALIAMSWPGFKDARAWLNRASDVTRREIMEQTYPDGAYKELTNHYQHIVADSLERTLAVLRAAGRRDTLLEERAVKMWDYYAEVMRPNGDGPLNSACDVEYNRAYVKDAAKIYAREDWAYIASAGEAGKMLDIPPSRYFPYAGHAVMRGGWTKDSQWSFFDIGPHGSAHQHNDRLHLDISLGEDDILTDSGRYTYQPGEWRDYFSGPRAHNILLVNGQGPLPPTLTVDKPLPVTAVIKDDYDFFAATNEYAPDVISGQGGARHTRSVFYMRGDYWLVIDNVIAFGDTNVETLWHFRPTVEVSKDANGEILARAAKSTLLIKEVYGPEERWDFVRGATDPIQGWFSREYNARQPATAGTASVKISRPETFVWLLYPATLKTPDISVQRSGKRLVLKVKSGGTTAVLDIDPANDAAPVISTGAK
jgi:hypothetical protein